MVSVLTRSLRLLVVIAAVVATASSSRAAVTPAHLRTLSLARELAGSSDGDSSPTIAPTPTTALPAPTVTPTAEPKTPPPTTEKPRDEAASGSKDAGATSAPPTPSPTPSPKKTKDKTPAPSSDEPPATVKTRSSVSTTTTTAPPVADEAGVTGNAALASGAVKSEYGTKAPANGDASDSETVSTSSAPKSASGWIVPVIIGCVIVSALVVVTVYVRHKRTDDDDDDDDVDDFQRRRTTNNHNNFLPHPRTTNHQMGFNSVPAPMNMHDLEPPLFKPSVKPANVSVHAVSMQPTAQPQAQRATNPHARKFSIPMLQSPVRASGESIDGRDTVSRVTSPSGSRESHHERITARFTSASMSGVTL